MKKIQIIHNPGSGNGEHSKDDLLDLVSGSGYKAFYFSTDEEEWREFHKNKCDLILLAGGDGTVRRIAGELLKDHAEKIPLYLLPLGTANNIAHTLGLSERLQNKDLQEMLSNQLRNFDCGSISGYSDESFFVESMGFGIFPKLISEMKKDKVENEGPEEKLERTLRKLKQIVKNFKPQEATIKTDGMTIKGSFLLAEVMNIQSLGPNLKLAPNADPGDGYLDLVLIPANKRSQLENYLEQLLAGTAKDTDNLGFMRTMRIKKLKITWKGSYIHVDDNYSSDYSGEEIKLKIIPRAFQFLNKKNSSQ